MIAVGLTSESRRTPQVPVGLLWALRRGNGMGDGILGKLGMHLQVAPDVVSISWNSQSSVRARPFEPIPPDSSIGTRRLGSDKRHIPSAEVCQGRERETTEILIPCRVGGQPRHMSRQQFRLTFLPGGLVQHCRAGGCRRVGVTPVLIKCAELLGKRNEPLSCELVCTRFAWFYKVK